MRKYLLLLLLAAFTATAFSQQLPATELPDDYDYYMKKSYNEKTLGWILTTAGTAGFIFSVSKDMGQLNLNLFDSGGAGSTSEDYYTSYYVLSGLAIAAGICAFSAARHSRQKAALLQTSFKMEQAPALYNSGISRKASPSVALTVGL